MHKLKVVPRVTVRGMRVPKSVGDVKDFPILIPTYIGMSSLYQVLNYVCS